MASWLVARFPGGEVTVIRSASRVKVPQPVSVNKPNCCRGS